LYYKLFILVNVD